MRRIAVLLMTAALCFALCGCTSWMDGNYASVNPHREQNLRPEQESVSVSTYVELRQALEEMVEGGTSTGIITFTGFDKQMVGYYMSIAIRHAQDSNPIGAYAVDEITYELGTNAGKTAAAVEITYLHSRSEILRIKQTKGMDEATQVITAALDNCDAGVVVQTSNYENVDITQLVQDYADSHPESIMETPQVTVVVYPESGQERVIELSFTYQTSRDDLRSMQATVEPVFESAKLYVSADAEIWEKYSQLYAFLMERHDYTVETSITPSYSLLRHGVGDSKAFAAVYAAMCRQIGLDCEVVSGTRAGEPRYWNIIRQEGVNYHIDLLQCNATGGFRLYTEQEMSGYVWDYSAYAASEESPE